MIKKSFSLVLVLVMMLSLVSGVTACNPAQQETTGEFQHIDYETVNKDEYNKNLYYINELKFQIADPSVIYITEGEEEGYFYAYGTSDLIQCHGIQTWRSKDLTNWEYMGVAFEPDFSETWAHNNYWAPEVLYDEEDQLYYMFYSAMDYRVNNRLCISVAYSENPYGPFECPDGMENANGKLLTVSEPVYDFSSILPNREGLENQILDNHAFVDPVTGDKYMYFSAYQDWGVPNKRSYQEIYGVKMKDWFTPDYGTLKQLTSIYNTTVDDFRQEMDSGNTHFGDIDEGGNGYATVNEGPFLYYKDGTYFLTFSVYAYTSELYQVRQAISDSPLGDFTKIQPDEGGTVLATSTEWGNIASSGHHCFIKCGDELMIAYHTFLDRRTIEGGRALAVDRVTFVEDENGQVLMHSNGPTYSYQPLPAEISGYENVALDATITASNTAADSDVKYLNDGIIKIHDYDLAKEYKTSEATSTQIATINLKFDDWVNARSVLVYNSMEYNQSFVQLEYVKMKYLSASGEAWVQVDDVPFDYTWHSDSRATMLPGGTSIVEFDELPVNEIEIGIKLSSGVPSVSIGEIYVMGKHVDDPQPVTAFADSYSYENPQIGDYIKYADGVSVGSVGGFNTTWGYGDLSTDDGTENAYIENTAPGDQFAYFKNATGDYFYFEAELTITEDKPYRMWNGSAENYPKFGLVLRSNTGSTFFYIDSAYNGDFTNEAVGYTQRKSDNSDYDWTNTEKVIQVPGLKYTKGNYAKLAIARMGTTYYFFANDTLIAEASNLRGLNNEVVGGCLVFNMGIRVRNYNVINGQENVSAQIEKLGAN